eukprot:CAMPEP_0183481638 /NCGR_PEP_ID=MMETSP0370-20130417/175288_1 /TAXON_ID=268820 /ORGANISM="Peridinium aciculiferum, Strain PAER-2" /LENGTH=83 /DNA_ID=CAMNT_0025674775 /DNA_START=31 /DNA_END=278 /DNA_ORIENTATION=-
MNSATPRSESRVSGLSDRGVRPQYNDRPKVVSCVALGNSNVLPGEAFIGASATAAGPAVAPEEAAEVATPAPAPTSPRAPRRR